MPHAYPAQVHAASRACRWCVPCAGLTLPGTEASALPVLPCALCASGLTFSPSQTRNMPVWLPGQDQPLPSRNCAIRAGDKGWWSLPACTLLPSSLTLVCLAEEGTLYSSGSLFQAARQDVPPPNQEPPAPKSGPPPPPGSIFTQASPHHPSCLLGTLPCCICCALTSGWGDQEASSSSSARSSSPVPYDICRPDHSVLTLKLPVTASVREVMAALAQEDGWTKGQVLVKVNSAGGELCLWVGWP